MSSAFASSTDVPPRLVLFDIDGTLIATAGMGIRAMEAAGKDLFGDRFSAEGVDYAGAIDPLIVAALFDKNAVEHTPDTVLTFRAAYAERLGAALAPAGASRALPGVIDLVAALAEQSGVELGLLTGNYEETGSLKLTRAGIEPSGFRVRVWGDDSPHDPPRRDHLAPVAIGRSHRMGHEVAASRVVVIGDTPHDVSCARAGGCCSIGVGTGRWGASELAEHGADLALDDLARTEEVVGWIMA